MPIIKLHPLYWVVLYTHIAQLMTHTTNLYITAAYLANMLVTHLHSNSIGN